MDNPFLKAIFVQPRVVLGRELLPFSAYHAAALMLLDSPFITVTDEPVTGEDLVVAAYICSHGFVDGPKHLFPSVDIVDILEWGAATGEYDEAAEFESFNEYMSDYLDFPELWQPASHGKQKVSGIPWPVYCVGSVLQNMRGISEQQAWDMPLNRLVSYKCAIAEQNGAEVINEAQRNRIKWIELQEAAAKEEANGNA